MFSRIKAIILEHLYRLRRSPDEWIDTFFWPVMDIIIWGLTSVYFNKLGGTTAKVAFFLLGGLILWTIAWRTQQDVSLSLMADVWNQNLINLFASPLSVGEYLIATMILGVIKIFLTIGAVSLIALFLYSFSIFSLGFYLAPLMVILLIFAWALGIFITGLILRYGRRVQFLAWSLIFLIQPVSCVYYPLASLPLFLQQIAIFVPTTYVFEAMRKVLQSEVPANEYFIFGFITAFIWLIFSCLLFQFFYKEAKEKGTLAKIEG